MRVRCAALLLFALLLVPVLVFAADEDEEGWSAEVGLLSGNHDNFFYRGPGAAAPSSDLFNVYLDAEWLRDLGRSEVTVLASGGAVFVSDVDSADYETIALGAEYKLGPNKFSAVYSRLFNRLYAEEGEAVFFDGDSFEVWARRSLGPRVWVRLGAEIERWDFDPAENDRDSDVLGLDGTVRFALSPKVGLRASLLWEDRDARALDQDRTSSGYSLAVEAQPSERMSLFLRFRSRDREYDDAPPGSTNFGRDDTVDDINFNLRYRVGRSWGVQVRDEYREGDSTRPDRNFDGNLIAVGGFYQF